MLIILIINSFIISIPENTPKRNRGKEANDPTLFGASFQTRLKTAFIDLNDLLTKGYPLNASLSLICNHHRLNKRQRQSLSRATGSNQQVELIKNNEIESELIKGNTVYIDGFNILILLESALSEAYVFECADGTFRDLSGVHGTYKRVTKTNAAIILIGEALKRLKPANIVWVLDRPVSNSGKLKGIIESIGIENNYNWEVLLDFNPDAYLVKMDKIAISSDSWIVERSKWFNLGKQIISQNISNAEIFRFTTS